MATCYVKEPSSRLGYNLRSKTSRDIRQYDGYHSANVYISEVPYKTTDYYHIYKNLAAKEELPHISKEMPPLEKYRLHLKRKWMLKNAHNLREKLPVVLLDIPENEYEKGMQEKWCRILARPMSVGESLTTPGELSNSTSHVLNAPVGSSLERPRFRWSGEIGWSLPHWQKYYATNRSGCQIQIGEFRKESHDRWTHRHMSPWYPIPECKSKCDKTEQDSDHHSQNGKTY